MPPCALLPTRSVARPSSLAALWAAGDLRRPPIVLALIDETDDIDIIRQLLRAHEYWRMKRLAVDLVIINEKAHFLSRRICRARSKGLCAEASCAFPPRTRATHSATSFC